MDQELRNYNESVNVCSSAQYVQLQSLPTAVSESHSVPDRQVGRSNNKADVYLFLHDVAMHSLRDISCVDGVVVGILMVTLLYETWNKS